MTLLDLRSSLRRLRRTPRLTLAAVLCVAVGAAATSAAFTLVSAALLRPLPYPDAERLTRIWLTAPDGEPRIALSYPDLRDLATGLSTVDALEATARARLVFQGAEGGRRVEGEAVTPGYFALLGVEPVLGRTFTAEEHEPGGERVILLHHGTWGQRYGFDPAVLGSVVATDDGEHTVIGVLPADFDGTVEEDSGSLEFWLPIADYLSPERREARTVGGIWTLARRAPGATPAALAAEVATVGGRIAAAHPDVYAGRSFTSEPMGESWRERIRDGSLLVLAAATLLLLVATGNVAVLFLARAVEARRELAIRAALGAARRRLLVALAVESALVVAAGCVLGLLVGPPLLRAVLAGGSLVDGSLLGLPVFVRLGIDPRVAAFTALVFLVTALLAGLAPAAVGARVAPARALQEGGRSGTVGRRSRRFFESMVGVEVAITTVLLVGAGLLVRTYQAMGAADLGFRTAGVSRIGLFADPRDAGDEELAAFFARAAAAVAEEPGVDRVGMVWPTVPIDWPVQVPLTVPGLGDEGEAPRAGLYLADPSFFAVLDVPVLAGRGFRAGDDAESAPVAVVNRELAAHLAERRGSDEAAVLGTEVVLREDPIRIVGVVGDVRFGGPREDAGGRFELYLPLAQSPQRMASLLVASDQDPATLLPALRRRVAAVAPASALDWVGPLDGWVRDLYLLDTRFLLSLVALFAVAGLILAAVGLFAVLADSVARRRGELGLRQALGGTPGRIVGEVVGRALRVVALGLAAGGALSWAAVRVLDSKVYGVATTDPWSYLAAAAVLLAATLLASALPARRAGRVDPATALRGS